MAKSRMYSEWHIRIIKDKGTKGDYYFVKAASGRQAVTRAILKWNDRNGNRFFKKKEVLISVTRGRCCEPNGY